MDDAAWTAVAALGAAAVTAFASFGLVTFQERRRDRAELARTVATALVDLLARSLDLSLRARAAGDAIKVRSGLAEGVNVTLGMRPPLDTLELHDWFAVDWQPLGRAWSQLWSTGDQRAIGLANDLMATTADLLGISTASEPVGGTGVRVRQLFAGQRWTPEMLASYEAALRDMARARAGLADHARATLGLDPVDFFAGGHGGA